MRRGAAPTAAAVREDRGGEGSPRRPAASTTQPGGGKEPWGAAAAEKLPSACRLLVAWSEEEEEEEEGGREGAVAAADCASCALPFFFFFFPGPSPTRGAACGLASALPQMCSGCRRCCRLPCIPLPAALTRALDETGGGKIAAAVPPAPSCRLLLRRGVVSPPPPPLPRRSRSRPAFPPAARGAGALPPPPARPGDPHGVLPGHQLPAPQQRALPRHQRRLQGTALQEGRSLAGNCHLLAPSLTCPPHGRSGAGGWVCSGPWVPTQRGGGRGAGRRGDGRAGGWAGDGGVGPPGSRCVGTGSVSTLWGGRRGRRFTGRLAKVFPPAAACVGAGGTGLAEAVLAVVGGRWGRP